MCGWDQDQRQAPPSLEAGDRIVAGHHQQIAHASAVERVELLSIWLRFLSLEVNERAAHALVHNLVAHKIG